MLITFFVAYINKKYMYIYVHEKNEYYLSVNLGVENKTIIFHYLLVFFVVTRRSKISRDFV